MKQILALSLILLSFSLSAQVQKSVKVDTIKTPQALCDLCKVKIENYLNRYDGVMEINVNIRRGVTKVKYATERINIEEIKTAIANCGFDADDVPAAPDFYKLLPPCCKKPEDGGIKPKTPPAPVQQRR